MVQQKQINNMWIYKKVWIRVFFKFIVFETNICKFWECKPVVMGKWHQVLLRGKQKKAREDLTELLGLDDSLNIARQKRCHIKLRVFLWAGTQENWWQGCTRAQFMRTKSMFLSWLRYASPGHIRHYRNQAFIVGSSHTNPKLPMDWSETLKPASPKLAKHALTKKKKKRHHQSNWPSRRVYITKAMGVCTCVYIHAHTYICALHIFMSLQRLRTFNLYMYIHMNA